MSSKMLIDASHPEETRVVVVHGNRIEEFDFESQHKKQLRGNIYLARVTRVEPSLQAAFVEYGGNRHGFLAFSEIHPDYYQIPFADRQALLEAEAAEHDEDDEDAPRERNEREGGRNRDRNRNERGRNRGRKQNAASLDGDNGASDGTQSLEGVTDADNGEAARSEDASPESAPELADDDKPIIMEMAVDEDEVSEVADGENARNSADVGDDDDDDDNDGHIEEQEVIESVGAEDAMEEVPTRRRTARKQYKIQEVIKRRQVLLVQVVKEERGNKGAALTTYLSLAGRYSVLMPNTGRGGGISRKITSAQDRKRLKEVVKDLEVPKGMGVILRTAGANRTKVEIKRDYEYLMRAWETVRTLTLQSSAPALVYEEGSLIKRSIRDLYNKDIGEILVAGENGYREAKDFMRMLMPSHAKMVQPYRDPSPIFARQGIEAQLDRMLQPQVTLKSGGYIIINQTEALVSVDVNSGRSTREHSIEDTALQTNLEAAEEVARQLRLRDLAGLIVIDFIDMEEKRNNRAVEKRLKDNLKNDRARIQVGRISHFGLLEMSRQRIRASVLESTMQVCAHCGGTGHVRSQSSVGLHVIRTIEEALLRSAANDLIVKTPIATALYVLNQKRDSISDLEGRFGVRIAIEADEKVGAQHVLIERGGPASGTPRGPVLPAYDDPADDADDLIVDEESEEETIEVKPEANLRRPAADKAEGSDGERRRKRRRRRRGRGRDEAGSNGNVEAGEADAEDDAADDVETVETAADAEVAGEVQAEAETTEGAAKPKRRRSRRGGRKDDDAAPQAIVSEESATAAEQAQQPVDAAVVEAPVAETPKKRVRRKKADSAVEAAEAEAVAEPAPAEAQPAEPVAAAAETKPARASRRKAAEAEAPAEPVVSSAGTSAETEAPRKGGWWQRKGFF